MKDVVLYRSARTGVIVVYVPLEEGLRARSLCCEVNVYWRLDSKLSDDEYDWFCSKCQKSIKTLDPKTPRTYISIRPGIESQIINESVAFWLGVPIEMVKVNVS